MTVARVNYINIALMLISAAVAFVIPFELFLFSYAVLGPLHYLTEISWLHKRQYFSPNKYDWILLTLLTFFLTLPCIMLHLVRKTSTVSCSFPKPVHFLRPQSRCHVPCIQC